MCKELRILDSKELCLQNNPGYKYHRICRRGTEAFRHFGRVTQPLHDSVWVETKVMGLFSEVLLGPHTLAHSRTHTRAHTHSHSHWVFMTSPPSFTCVVNYFTVTPRTPWSFTTSLRVCKGELCMCFILKSCCEDSDLLLRTPGVSDSPVGSPSDTADVTHLPGLAPSGIPVGLCQALPGTATLSPRPPNWTVQ